MKNNQQNQIKPFVLVGGECTGKSSLATALSSEFDVPLSSEFASIFAKQIFPHEIEEKHARPIADGQINLQQRAREEAILRGQSFWIADTDLVSTLVYCQELYGRYPGGLEDEVRDHQGHFYFLLSPAKVPWVPRADRGQALDRMSMFECFRRALDRLRLEYLVVSDPSFEERLGLISENILEKK